MSESKSNLNLALRNWDFQFTRVIFLSLLTELLRTENWEAIGLFIDAFENYERNQQVKKCNEYLKNNPMEIRYP